MALHRFCSECKSKVIRAYNILVGEVDSAKEKGYCPALYEGLRCCPQERHIHMLCETDFIAHLISRAEPELIGRFVKLICLYNVKLEHRAGIHIGYLITVLDFHTLMNFPTEYVLLSNRV